MLEYIISAISRAIGFSKVEARGTLFLILIMSVTIIVSQLYVKTLKSKPKMHDQSDLSSWIAEVKSSYNLKKEDSALERSIYNQVEKKSKKVASPSREIENKEFVTLKDSFKDEPIEIKDLNAATSEELQRVRGIGPAFSSRIVKYRDRLGGFVSNDQLNEVYGLKKETITELSNYFTVQSSPNKIDFNSDSAKYLAQHPYISYDLAWLIINYRKQNGDIHSLDDLRKIKAIDKETLNKLRPYLD